MKPAPLTDAEIANSYADATGFLLTKNSYVQQHLDRSDNLEFARAIESVRDAQWIKMLGNGEAVAYGIKANTGRIVDYLSAEDSCYLSPYKPEDIVPLFSHPAPQPTTEPVGYISGTYAGRFIFEPLNPAQVLPDRTALYLHPSVDHTALLRQALEALEACSQTLQVNAMGGGFTDMQATSAITAIKEALNVQSD